MLAVVVLGFIVLLISGAGRASASAVPTRTGLSQAGTALSPAGIAPAPHVRPDALSQMNTAARQMFSRSPGSASAARSASALAVGPVAAQELPEPDDPGQAAELPVVINNATQWLRQIVVVVATCTLTLAGLFYLMARDPQSVDRAKSFAGAAVAGYALALLAPQILQVVQSILGVG